MAGESTAPAKTAARALKIDPHGWPSHAADAFDGLMCISYEEPERAAKDARIEHGEGGWMG